MRTAATMAGQNRGRAMRAPARPKVHRAANASMMTATSIIVVGAAAGALLASSATSVNEAFAAPAPVLGGSLLAAALIEARHGARNMLRTDLLMLAALYLLTFLEFLFPQPPLDYRVSLGAAQEASVLGLVGFAGIAVGRHAFPLHAASVDRSRFRELTPGQVVLFLSGVSFLGYLHILLAVNFDIGEALYQMSRPRFSQPWTRGRYGSLSTLLNEVGLLIYLIPPICGAIFAQRRRYGFFALLLAAALLGVTVFYGFAGGTRNVLLTHLATFGGAFLMLQPRLSWSRVMVIGSIIVGFAGFSIYYLPEIRTVGLAQFDLDTARTDVLFVDLNLVNVAQLIEVFPRSYDFLGWEIPYIAAIRPIPRALWPGKPEGLSIGIEEALDVSGLTLSATFIGEFYMAGGFLAVLIASLLHGVAAGAWNRVGASVDSNMRLVLYASGFFAAGLAMRGFLSIMPTLLPTLALWILLRKGSRGRR